MKKALPLLLALFLLLSLVTACGESADTTVTTTTTEATTTTEEIITTTGETATTTTATSTTKVTTTSKIVTTTRDIGGQTTTVKPTTTIATTTTTTTKATTTTTTATPTEYKTSIFTPYINHTLPENTPFDFSILVTSGVYASDYEQYFSHTNDEGYEFYYAIPEAVMLKAIRTKFAISDADFELLKQQGTYQNYGPESTTYENGVFTFKSIDGWGGGWDYGATIVGYTQSGNELRICADYGVDREFSGTYEHEYYYELVYTFSGNGAITVGKDSIVSMDKTVIDSMRIASMKKVTDTSPYTLKPTL